MRRSFRVPHQLRNSMAYDDYEQSEQVRNWLRENIMSIVGGVAIGLLLIFGAHQWRKHQANHSAGAASAYQALQQAVSAGDTAESDRLLAELKDQYKSTPFSVFAALDEAQRAVASEDSAAAAAALSWAAQHAEGEALKSLVALRQARVALAAEKPDRTLTLLASIAPATYGGMAEELRGDAFVALSRDAEARTAYTAAIEANGETAPQNRLIQLKLENLAAAAPAATSTAASTAVPAAASTAAPAAAQSAPGTSQS